MDDKNQLQIFVDNLRTILKNDNISIVELSSKTGIPRTTISSWLNRNSNPSIDALCKLSKYFECTIDFLVGIEDEFGNKKLH